MSPQQWCRIFYSSVVVLECYSITTMIIQQPKIGRGGVCIRKITIFLLLHGHQGRVSRCSKPCYYLIYMIGPHVPWWLPKFGLFIFGKSVGSMHLLEIELPNHLLAPTLSLVCPHAQWANIFPLSPPESTSFTIRRRNNSGMNEKLKKLFVDVAGHCFGGWDSPLGRMGSCEYFATWSESSKL